MGLLGNILSSVINPASLVQLAMGPAGWMSMGARIVGSTIGQQVIQQLGQRLGLPQSMIDLSKTAFAAASGTRGLAGSIAEGASTVARQFNFTPAQEGRLSRDMQSAVREMTEQAWQNAERQGLTKSKAGAKSWLGLIAEALGQAVDRKVNSLNGLAANADKSRQASTDYQVAVQEFGLLMTTLTNTIKTIGEAQQTIARKQ